MKNLVFAALVIFLATLISGCRKGIDKELVGTWNVEKVEVDVILNGQLFANESDTMPTGTVTFNSNGKGEQNYSYSYENTMYFQTGTFRWSATDEFIIIERATESDMEWRRITKTSNKQVATFNVLKNADQSTDYTLTLEK